MRLTARDNYTSSTHWWESRSRSKFASHNAWGTNGVCECKMDVSLHGFPHVMKWIMFHGHLDYFQEPPLRGRTNTKPGDHGTLDALNCWFILLYHVWGPAWVEIPWNNTWLRARSHMTSHFTWGSVTTLHDFGVVLARHWACSLASHNFMAWSRLLACVWSGSKHSFLRNNKL